MKILQINCVYKIGSTGKITYDIHKGLLDRGIESIVCYGRQQKENEPNVYKTCGELESHIYQFVTRITGLMFGSCEFATNRLIKRIKEEKPHIVHLQCINGYFVNIYKLMNWLKENKIKTLLTLHAEFMYTANCGHALECEKWRTGCGKCPRLKGETKSYFIDNTKLSWKKMKDAFDNFDNLYITSVSPWLMERAKESAFLANKKHYVVLNGLDTNIFHKYDVDKRKDKYNLKEKVIFQATAYFSTDKNNFKGGYYICELAKKMPNVSFVVAGSYSNISSIPNNVILLGRIEDQVELAKWYSISDLTVLTSKKETFSMVTAESLCCGTPVVGFKAGAPEMIALKEYSDFVEYGNIDELYKSVIKMLEKNKTNNISMEAKKAYDTNIMVENYISCYNDLYNI